MLEIRKNTFSKSYENTFFREFSKHLYNSFKEKNLTGVLLGSPLCEADERLQIDALLITPSVVCIIDFKNFKDKVNLPSERDFEIGLWTTEAGEQIRGGNSINPYVQLKIQRKRFYDVCQKSVLRFLARGDAFNPARVVRVICFQGEIQLQGSIPATETNTFFIIDKVNFVERILDIVDVTDKEVRMSETSFDAFKKVFRADQFKFDDKPLEDKLKEVASKSTKLDYTTLYDDQRAALTEIKSFLESKEQQVFVLQGTTNSGKSYLIPFIQEIAFANAIQEAEVFAASSRVAKNLLSASGLENVNSIYSYIYGGNKTETQTKEEETDSEETENEEQESSDDLSLETIPLKKCDDADNALFIVDESQLVSDSLYHSVDLIFGSGHLLQDFIDFTEFQKTKRKIIFIGDPYQLQLGKTDESPLNPAYLEEHHKLKTSCFQLMDKEQFSPTTKEALTCAKSIREKHFNSLRFDLSENISILSREAFQGYTENIFKSNSEVHYLYFSNEEAHKANLWIKKYILKNGGEIYKGDLMLFNNNISIEDEADPNARPKKIYNGQFAKVISVSENIIPETVKDKPTILNFREIELQLTESGNSVKVLSLENYRLNPKGELSKEEYQTLKTLLNIQISKHTKENPFEKTNEYSEIVSSNDYQTFQKEINELKSKIDAGERVKGKLKETEIAQRKLFKAAKRKHKSKIETSLRKDPTTKYYKLKNAALLRYGWAMTVHKSMSYKWNEIVFNVEQGETAGKTNETYFRWLYTGLSRARQKVNLINYKPISPFDKTEFTDGNSGVKPKDIFYIAENESQEERLSEFSQLVSHKLTSNSFSILNTDHHKNQEVFTIQGNSKEKTSISVYYKNDGKFNLPSVMKSEPKEFGEAVIEILKQKKPLASFSFIKDNWRKTNYETLSEILNGNGISFEMILQTKYKDKIKFFSNDNELDIELDYSGDGMVSFVTAKFYNTVSIWEDFKKAIETIKN